MTILFLTYREKCFIFDIWGVLWMYNILKYFFQLNSVIICYVCVQLIKFICVASLQNSPLVGRNESGIILDWSKNFFF